jgi:hypothetical protein
MHISLPLGASEADAPETRFTLLAIAPGNVSPVNPNERSTDSRFRERSTGQRFVVCPPCATGDRHPGRTVARSARDGPHARVGAGEAWWMKGERG